MQSKVTDTPLLKKRYLTQGYRRPLKATPIKVIPIYLIQKKNSTSTARPSKLLPEKERQDSIILTSSRKSF
jgi:DNA-binding beta-propeller fold protein YncE